MVSNLKNLNLLESLRTKEELINYFEEKGQSITEEEIEELRKSYENAEKSNGTLTLEQLDNVAGGVVIKLHYDMKTLSHKIETIKNNSELITLHVLSGESREELFENLTPEQLVQHLNHHTQVQDIVTEAYEEYVKGHPFDREDVDFRGLHNTQKFLSTTPSEQLQEIRMNHVLANPYHEDFPTLLHTMQSDEKLKPIATQLEQSFNRSNPRLQTCLNLAARCIPHIALQDMREDVGGLTLPTNSIFLDPRIINSEPFVTIHESGHTLINLFDLTKGMDTITEKVHVSKGIHKSFAGMMCDPGIKQEYGIARLVEILDLLPNREYASKMLLTQHYEGIKGSLNDEILARMFELDNYTNGKWILPLTHVKDENYIHFTLSLKANFCTAKTERVRELKLKKILEDGLDLRTVPGFSDLINFYEDRIGIVTDFANKIYSPDATPATLSEAAKAAAAAAASPYVADATVAPPEKTLTPEERSASFLPDHLKKKPSAGAAKKGKGSHTGKGKGKKK